MRYFWSRFMMLGLFVQAVLFILYYIYGSCGMRAERKLQEQKNFLEEQIDQMQMQINDVKEEIQAWQTGLFLQEKFAREKLQMKKENEIIYFRQE